MNKIRLSSLLRKYGLVLLFIILLFLRFYHLEGIGPFGWDQVDNAWAAKKIIVDHELPLLGMQAKLSSGLYIGPLYYYLISIFYFFTNLDPIASPIFAGVTSIISFFTLFYVCKKLFSFSVGLIAAFLNTIAFGGIIFDRVQWPISFIPAVSIFIFYCLYKIMMGNPKYAIPLSIVLGFSFHLHFTAIFFPIIIILSLPFWPRTKEMVKYAAISVVIFAIWMVPSVVSLVQKSQDSLSILQYGQTYNHGLHLTRVLQLTNDAFIEFERFIVLRELRLIKFIIIFLFVLVYLRKPVLKEKLAIVYLIALWFLVPWLIISMYSGEISDYYFSINRFIVLLIIAFLLSKLFQLKSLVVKILMVSFLMLYTIFNLQKFFLSTSADSLKDRKEVVLQAIKEGREVELQEGVPESYIYYYYMRKKGKEVY